MTEMVVDVFPPCPDCGWDGFPRYRSWSAFTVRTSERLGPGQFYVTSTRCSNCDVHYRMYRPAGQTNWVHDVKVPASA